MYLNGAIIVKIWGLYCFLGTNTLRHWRGGIAGVARITLPGRRVQVLS